MVEEECLGKGGELLLWSACAAMSRICWVFILHSTSASKKKKRNWFYKWVKSFIFSKVFSGNYCIRGFCVCCLGNFMLQWSDGLGEAFGLVSEEQSSSSRVSARMARNCLAASEGSSTWRCSFPSVLLAQWVSRGENGLRYYLHSGIRKR